MHRIIGNFLVLLLSLSCSSAGNLFGNYWSQSYGTHSLHYPLAVISHVPLSTSQHLTRVPLIAVPQQQLSLYDNPHISHFSKTSPIVTCQVDKYSVDAMMAVRVKLPRPLLLNDDRSVIGFPSTLDVLHDGLRLTVPVGALLAPVPEQKVTGQHIISYVYAVPVTVQSPFYAHSQLSYPFSPLNYDYKPAIIKPQYQYPSYPGLLKPTIFRKPIVNVLHFPSQIATPGSLVYKPTTVLEDELTNKNEVHLIAPAGIVQSSQPSTSLQFFVNSKESPLLQILRDEAKRTEQQIGRISGVESL